MNLKEFSDGLELAGMGFANGKAPGYPFTEKEKWKMVDKAADAYGKFLDALGCDWKNDPNSSDTPRRVAKAYVFDLWKGRYDLMDNVTAFPSDGYDGMVFEGNIPITSMCSHHHQTIQEQYTVAVHNAVNKICEGNQGVAVMVEATHNCVSCRGVKHAGASMKTSKLSGCFMMEDSARAEFYEFVKGYSCK